MKIEKNVDKYNFNLVNIYHDVQITATVVLMLARRRRLWANIKPALAKRLVFAGAGSILSHEKLEC